MFCANDVRRVKPGTRNSGNRWEHVENNPQSNWIYTGGIAGGQLESTIISLENRRTFLSKGTLCLAAGVAGLGDWAVASPKPDDRDNPQLRFGLLTDCHYADRNSAGTRVYRESLQKIREAVDQFNNKGATMAIELGDFIDAADDVKTEIGYLKAIEREYARFKGDRHYVLGNHCVHTLTKEEFLDNCAMPAAYSSFDHGGFHFIVLDACYRTDGVDYGRKNFNWTDANIPPGELEWLADDLKQTELRSIVFAHQRLDVKNHYGVRNAAVVRNILEKSKSVLAVLQGHNHVNDHRLIGNIHYCTLPAVVEGTGDANNAYALVDLFADGTIHIDGFRKQKDYQW